jgi:hypothetical protein
MVFKEEYKNQSIGEFRDIITHKDGTIETTPWKRNTIVDDIGKLVACLMKGQAGYSGIGYWVIGSGLDAWDDVTPPAPSVGDHGVVTEVGRKQITTANMSFIDSNGTVTGVVTNRILIDVTFGNSECNGRWREFSIMGGNATATAGTGIAVNHKTHGLIVKTDQMQIERQIRFTFR